MNADAIRARMIENGHVFQSTTDSDLLLTRIAGNKAETLEDAVIASLRGVPASYSLLVMSPTKLVALRDRYGVRPLSIARMGQGYLIASETSAFHIFEGKAKFVKEVEPGEMVVFDMKDPRRFRSIEYVRPQERTCSFEFAYFSDPLSRYRGFEHTEFRLACGKRLYAENQEYFARLAGDDRSRLVPILDSGKQGTWGFAQASGIDYREYFQRRHNAPKAEGRSYTAPDSSERDFISNAKLDLRKHKIEGKIIITGDDSNVRGTTAKNNNRRLREAGALQIINLFFTPAVVGTCPLGMNHQNLNDLVAIEPLTHKRRTNKQTAKEIGADDVFYLSNEGWRDTIRECYGCGACDGCLGGSYPACCDKYTNKGEYCAGRE
jgi:amidophosphoribosyltransferase